MVFHATTKPQTGFGKPPHQSKHSFCHHVSTAAWEMFSPVIKTALSNTGPTGDSPVCFAYRTKRPVTSDAACIRLCIWTSVPDSFQWFSGMLCIQNEGLSLAMKHASNCTQTRQVCLIRSLICFAYKTKGPVASDEECIRLHTQTRQVCLICSGDSLICCAYRTKGPVASDAECIRLHTQTRQVCLIRSGDSPVCCAYRTNGLVASDAACVRLYINKASIPDSQKGIPSEEAPQVLSTEQNV